MTGLDPMMGNEDFGDDYFPLDAEELDDSFHDDDPEA